MTERFVRKYRRLIIAGSVVIIVGGGIGLFYAFHHSPDTVITPAKTVSPANPSTSSASINTTSPISPTATTPASPVDKTEAQTGSNNSSSTTFKSPTGQVISSSTVSLSQNQELSSSCETLPNTPCDVRITSSDGSTTKYVGAQTTDSTGNTIFYWYPKSVGLTVGTWSVELVATSGSQTLASTPETLTVAP